MLIKVLEEKYTNFEYNGLEVIEKKMYDHKILEEHLITDNNAVLAPCGGCSSSSLTSYYACETGCNYSYAFCLSNENGGCDDMSTHCGDECCNFCEGIGY